MKHFIWILFLCLSANAQCLSGDCQNGFGKYKTKDGTIAYSFFENGKEAHFIILKKSDTTVTYQIVNGIKHGLEVKYHPKGGFELNQYTNGIYNGYTFRGNFKKLTAEVLIFENGNKKGIYHLDYENGKTSSKGYAACRGNCKNGLGLRRVDDTYYFGIFDKKKPSPIGIDQWVNSSEIYLGASHDFKRGPFGMYRFEDGTVFIGGYKKSKYDGVGVWISNEGVLHASVYKNDNIKEELYKEELVGITF